MNLKSAFFIALFTALPLVNTLAVDTQSGCGSDTCGSGEVFEVRFHGSGTAPVTSSGSVSVKMTVNGVTSVTVKSPNPDNGQASATTTEGSVKISLEKIYTGNVNLTRSGGMQGSGIHLAGYLDVQSACGLVFELRKAGESEWKEAGEVTADGTVEESITLGFELRLRKKSKDDAANNQSAVGNASPPTISNEQQDAAPGTNGLPAQLSPSSFSSSVPLGATSTSGGFNTGSIYLQGVISPSLASIANLVVRDPEGSGLSVVMDGGILRQVTNLVRLIDVQSISNGGVELRLYGSGAFGTTLVSGLYPINSGALPYQTVSYTPLSAQSGHLGGIRVTTTGPDQVPHVRDTVTTSADGTAWRVIEEGGLEVRDYVSNFEFQNSHWLRTDLVTVTRDNVLYSKVQRTYLYQTRREGTPAVMVQNELFLLAEQVYDSATTYLLSVWEPDPTFLGKAKSVSRTDGTWEAYTYYSGSETGSYPSWTGLKKSTLRPWNGTPTSPELASASNSESTVLTYDPPQTTPGEHLGHQVVRRTTSVPQGQGGSPVTIKDWARNSGAGSFSTMVGLLQEAGLDSAWIPSYSKVRQEGSTQYASSSEWLTTNSFSYVSSIDPSSPWIGSSFGSLDAEGNGSATGYERGTYNPTTGAFAANDPSGNPSNWGSDIRSVTVNLVDFGPAVDFEATREISIEDRKGRPYRKELWIKTAFETWSLATTTTYDYPAFWSDGTPKEVVQKRDGRIISRRNEISSTVTDTEDEQGIVIRTVKDGLGRTTSVTRFGIAAGSGREAQPDIVTTYSYSGRTTTTTTTAGAISRTQTSVEDLTGRPTSETDVTGAVTLTTYPNNGRDTLTTLPGGLTRLVSKNIDGNTVSISGSAVMDERTSYSAQSSGNIVTIHLIGDLPNSQRYTISERDWAGRDLSSTSPSPTGTGDVTTSTAYQTGTRRVISRTSPSGTVLFSHPEFGSSLSYTGHDVDGSTTLTPSSSDRLTESRQVYSLEGGYWWQVSTRKIYDQINITTSAITSISKQCLHGAPDGLAGKSVSISPGGAATTVIISIDRASKTLTETEVSGSSSNDAVSVNVNGLLVSRSGHDSASPTRWSYNAFGQPVRQTSPTGEITQKTYSPNGQLASTTDHLNKVTSFTYYGPVEAASGKLRFITNPDGKLTIYTYTSLGQVASQDGDAVYRITYEYDAYGARNKMWTWRDSNNSSLTQWVYQEGTGLLLAKSDAVGQVTGYTYEASGKIHSRTWARGVSTTYSYNAFGDLTGIDYSDSTPDVSLSGLDRLGRPTTITQVGIGSENLSYHPGIGAPNAEFYTSGHSLLPGVGIRHTAPDSFGRPSGFVETSDSDATLLRTVTYGYDTSGRFLTLTDGTETTEYGYKPDTSLISTVESKTAGSAWFKESRYYDVPGRLIGIRSDRMNGNSLVAGISSNAYDYDNLGRRSKVTYQDGARREFGYNSRSEVTSESRYTPAGTPLAKFGGNYQYDGIGNRTSSLVPSLGAHTYTPNSLNQYATITTGSARTATGRAPASWTIQVAGANATRSGDIYFRTLTASNSTAPVWQTVVTQRDTGSPTMTNYFWYAKASFSPTYDADGNLTNDGRWLYTWNAENRLVQMETTVDATTAGHPYTKLVFVYDWMGRRIARHAWQGGTQSSPTFKSSHRWLYDGWNVITEFSAPSDSSTTLTRTSLYTWGIDLSGSLQGTGGVGGLISQTTIASGVKERASYDGNGNIIAWTKSDQSAPTSRREYDAFGNTLVNEGTTPCSFGFSTKMQDVETGLYYYGYRFYDAEHGRWPSRDPIEEMGGVNLYLSFKNSPIFNIDIVGFSTIKVGALVKYTAAGVTDSGFTATGSMYRGAWYTYSEVREYHYLSFPFDVTCDNDAISVIALPIVNTFSGNQDETLNWSSYDTDLLGLFPSYDHGSSSKPTKAMSSSSTYSKVKHQSSSFTIIGSSSAILIGQGTVEGPADLNAKSNMDYINILTEALKNKYPWAGVLLAATPVSTGPSASPILPSVSFSAQLKVCCKEGKPTILGLTANPTGPGTPPFGAITFSP